MCVTLTVRSVIVLMCLQNNLKFWMDLGVDGFRIDSCAFLFEDEQLRDEVKINNSLPLNYENLIHNYTKDLNQTYQVVKQWSDYVASYPTSKPGETRSVHLK